MHSVPSRNAYPTGMPWTHGLPQAGIPGQSVVKQNAAKSLQLSTRNLSNRLKCRSDDTKVASVSDAHTPPSPAQHRLPLAFLDAFTIPDSTMAKQLGLTEEYLQALMDLPGTATTRELKSRLVALSQWNTSLQKGILPKAVDVDWPQEPFRSKFLDVLKKLEMPRFTRRHPKLLSSLIRQFLELAKEFEGELLEQEAQRPQQQSQPQNRPPQSPRGSTGDQESQEQQQQQQDGQTQGGEGASQEDPDGQQQEDSQEREGASQRKEESENGDIEIKLEDTGSTSGNPSGDGEEASSDGQGDGYAEKLAEELLKKFEGDWAPAMEALDTATQVFDNVDSLIDGPDGFDNTSSTWHSTGWREVAALKKRLENLRELRDLVRSLGRGGGKGPLKKAPEVVYRSKMPPGVIRSEESPEETRGLTRSGDLSRMLPLEAHLLAAGWPRQCKEENARNDTTPEETRGGFERCGDDSFNANDVMMVSADQDSHKEKTNEVLRSGSRACRLLFMARRAERMLMSYERTGWTENQPSRVTGRLEVRPAAELGPIIVCLDTSGSMYGAREVVAKALTLECVRGAHRQQRKCYVYAFSGPRDVMELELGLDSASMARLLPFLTMSFSGGTDVDAPLALSLERLSREEWSMADILMVTDGEIPMPDAQILSRLQNAKDELGLEVHGLLVGKNITEPMEELCTHLHVFKSWSAVGGHDPW